MFVDQAGGCSRLREMLRKRHPLPPRPRYFHFAWMLALLPLLMLIESASPRSASSVYDHAVMTFRSGYLVQSQQEAEQGYEHFRANDPIWAAKFQLLEVMSLSWQGKYVDAAHALAAYRPTGDLEDAVKKQALEGMVLIHRQQYAAASRSLAQADELCKNQDLASCGDLLSVKGILAGVQLQFPVARQYMLASLALARSRHDQWREAHAFLDMGWLANLNEQYDEAVDRLGAANRIAEKIGAKSMVAGTLGNLGINYYQLGDTERGLAMFVEAEKSAAELGDLLSQLRWVNNIGSFYLDRGDSAHAATSFQQALNLARRIDSKQDIISSLVYLAYAAIEAGKLKEADAYIDQLQPMVHATEDSREPLLLMQIKGNLASVRHQDRQAKAFYHAVEQNPASQITMRLQVGLRLARLYEREGRTQDAKKVYKAKLATFEVARAQLHQEDSKLPFMANAVQLYDGYIRLLVRQGLTDEALKVANQSRARTLEQSLERGKRKGFLQPAIVEPVQIARKTGANLLFYWLGEKQSYLWAITPSKTSFYTLPAHTEIASRITRYRKALLAVQNPLDRGPRDASNQDGRELYSMLVAPASRILYPRLPVVLLADGVLSQLNFETLLAPEIASSNRTSQNSAALSKSSASGTSNSSGWHYWIEDATILSAPSLTMLAAAKPDTRAQKRLLLMGNSLAYGEDYPELPMAGMEMKLVEKHFDPTQQTVLSRGQATPVTYLASSPEKYSYIHFVAHGTTSKTDPLNSAILLSRSSADEDSFKLYAREILRHPIDARLVTISSCYGGGTRSFAGEGLVGLSWAFLRAGAHSVIGAQWEVSDNATPRLMDNLYKGLEEGQTPSAALRAAKLTMLHSSGNFRAPFFWASFQIYTGH
jgi:CHAT domain-containing protein/tetratricopeptide (TPR) repeat protein